MSHDGRGFTSISWGRRIGYIILLIGQDEDVGDYFDDKDAKMQSIRVPPLCLWITLRYIHEHQFIIHPPLVRWCWGSSTPCRSSCSSSSTRQRSSCILDATDGHADSSSTPWCSSWGSGTTSSSSSTPWRWWGGSWTDKDAQDAIDDAPQFCSESTPSCSSSTPCCINANAHPSLHAAHPAHSQLHAAHPASYPVHPAHPPLHAANPPFHPVHPSLHAAHSAHAPLHAAPPASYAAHLSLLILLHILLFQFILPILFSMVIILLILLYILFIWLILLTSSPWCHTHKTHIYNNDNSLINANGQLLIELHIVWLLIFFSLSEKKNVSFNYEQYPAHLVDVIPWKLSISKKIWESFDHPPENKWILHGTDNKVLGLLGQFLFLKSCRKIILIIINYDYFMITLSILCSRNMWIVWSVTIYREVSWNRSERYFTFCSILESHEFCRWATFCSSWYSVTLCWSECPNGPVGMNGLSSPTSLGLDARKSEKLVDNFSKYKFYVSQ